MPGAAPVLLCGEDLEKYWYFSYNGENADGSVIS